MILNCPACGTRFLVEGLPLPPEGRNVRCGRCKHVWHQEPIALAAAPETPASDRPPPLSTEWKPKPLPANRTRRRRGLWAVNLAASGALLAFAGGLFLFRDEVVAAWEPAARLYDSVGLPVPVTGQGLAIEKLEVKTYRNAGKTALLVSGHIVNANRTEHTVPPLVLSVRDTARRELMQWVHVLPDGQQTLKAGEMIAFHTQQLVENELATNLLVRFGGNQVAAQAQ